jgi:hypothetical protein
MANFRTSDYKNKTDDYMTPTSALRAIQEYLPKNGIVWEPFYGDGKSGQYLKELGVQVVHKNKDFFTWKPRKFDFLVSNPPFSKKKKVLERLKELGKPFIMIMPASTLHTKYMHEMYGQVPGELQLLVPKRRLQFIRLNEDGEPVPNQANRCNFECFYFCWKMHLPNDIVFLQTTGTEEEEEEVEENSK